MYYTLIFIININKRGESMIKEIKDCNKYKSRLNTVLSELEPLEDGVDCDYSYVIVCLQQATQQLERRREQLQKKGRTL
ncbi:hypothetical protein [Methanobrevibacter sp. V14]|uniref:hypothetical protein n=1 Tax=Methanobrevibacter sp. V14 TaxID=3064280 RepID=UPI0027325227|nr:hypothetical protein [Methanobrevibacter sp. V14]